jgi:hypothetical protein
MPKQTNEFQKLVLLVKKHSAPGAIVTESEEFVDGLTGDKREVDIVIRSSFAGDPIMVCIECAERGRKPDVQWVEEMKAKHEKLPTNALYLASLSGFTRQARVLACKYGIGLTEYAEENDEAVRLLCDGADRLIGKVFELRPAQTVVTIKPTNALPAANVRGRLDNNVYLASGTFWGTVRELVERLLRNRLLVQRLGLEGSREDHWFEVQWERPSTEDGTRFCLEKEGSLELRPIEVLKVGGHCSFHATTFDLKRGKLSETSVAWSSASFGEGALSATIAATATTAGGEARSISFHGPIAGLFPAASKLPSASKRGHQPKKRSRR